MNKYKHHAYDVPFYAVEYQMLNSGITYRINNVIHAHIKDDKLMYAYMFHDTACATYIELNGVEWCTIMGWDNEILDKWDLTMDTPACNWFDEWKKEIDEDLDEIMDDLHV